MPTRVGKAFPRSLTVVEIGGSFFLTLCIVPFHGIESNYNILISSIID
jgi:hypothetical protein